MISERVGEDRDIAGPQEILPLDPVLREKGQNQCPRHANQVYDFEVGEEDLEAKYL